jgi:hypothetical protein
MVRRTDRPLQIVRVSFETTRFSAQHLIDVHPFSANGAADTGCADAQQGRAAASPGDDGKAAER